MARKSLPGSRTLMATGIALAALGALLLLTPVAAGDAVVRLVALVLAVTGGALMLHSLRAAPSVHKTASIVLGAIVAGVGILLWFNTELGSGFLAALLIAFFVINGLWKSATSVRFRPRARWWWLLLSGLLSLLLAALLWSQWPIARAWMIAVLVGIDLLLTGIPLIALARVLKKQGVSGELDTIDL